MMYFTCKNDIETATYIKDHQTSYLQVLVDNEKIFHNDPDKMEVYMKLEELESRLKAEAEARKKAEEEKAEAQAKANKAEEEKAEAQARADKAEADNAQLRAFLAKKGIDISTISD